MPGSMHTKVPREKRIDLENDGGQDDLIVIFENVVKKLAKGKKGSNVIMV